MAQEGLRTGEDLKPALERRNRELIQDDVIRAIIHYAELTAWQKQLVQAKAEGTPMEDLPPGMTLDEAIEKIKAQIAEEDRYVVTMEDGYLTRTSAESDVGGQSGTPAGAMTR